MTRPSKKLEKQLTKKSDGLGNNKARGEAFKLIQQMAQDYKKLAQNHNALAQITQNAISGIEDRLEDTSIILQAIIKTVADCHQDDSFAPKVSENAKAIRIKLLEDECAEQGKNVDKALAENKLVVEKTVNEACLVVTTIKKPDGTPMYPSKNYLPFGHYRPEVQAILRDKEVGAVLDLPTEGGGTIEILAIYSEAKATNE